MFQNRNFERQRETFAKQFAPEGDAFIYRRYQRGEAYRVTTAEHDAFVANFASRQKARMWWFTGVLVTALMIFIAIAVLLDMDTSSSLFTVGLTSGLIILMVIFVSSSMRDYTAPARELAARAPIANPLTADERRNQAFGQLTWRRLGTAALTMLAVPWLGSHGHPDGIDFGWVLPASVCCSSRFKVSANGSSITPPTI